MNATKGRLAVLLPVILLTGAGGESNACPQVLLFDGPRPSAPVAIAGVEKTCVFMGALERDAGLMDEVAGRAAYDVALFWDPSLSVCIADADCLKALPPSRAQQRGRYYPRMGAHAAVFVLFIDPLTTRASRIGSNGLVLLAEHGIPVEVRPREPPFCQGASGSRR